MDSTVAVLEGVQIDEAICDGRGLNHSGDAPLLHPPVGGDQAFHQAGKTPPGLRTGEIDFVLRCSRGPPAWTAQQTAPLMLVIPAAKHPPARPVSPFVQARSRLPGRPIRGSRRWPRLPRDGISQLRWTSVVPRSKSRLRRTAPYTMLKVWLVSPTPRAMVRIATTERPGVLMTMRSPWRTSAISDSTGRIREAGERTAGNRRRSGIPPLAGVHARVG